MVVLVLPWRLKFVIFSVRNESAHLNMRTVLLSRSAIAKIFHSFKYWNDFVRLGVRVLDTSENEPHRKNWMESQYNRRYPHPHTSHARTHVRARHAYPSSWTCNPATMAKRLFLSTCSCLNQTWIYSLLARHVACEFGVCGYFPSRKWGRLFHFHLLFSSVQPVPRATPCSDYFGISL